MIRYALNHPHLIALMVSLAIGPALLGAIATRFQQVAAPRPCIIELPPVVVVAKKSSLTAQLTTNSQGKL